MTPDKPMIDFGDGYKATSDGACWTLERPVRSFSKKLKTMTETTRLTYYPRLDQLCYSVLEYKARAGIGDVTCAELYVWLQDAAKGIEDKARASLVSVGCGDSMNVRPVRATATPKAVPQVAAPKPKRKRPRAKS